MMLSNQACRQDTCACLPPRRLWQPVPRTPVVLRLVVMLLVLELSNCAPSGEMPATAQYGHSLGASWPYLRGWNAKTIAGVSAAAADGIDADSGSLLPEATETQQRLTKESGSSMTQK